MDRDLEAALSDWLQSMATKPTAAEVWARLPRWARTWLTLLDIWANRTLFGGGPETISERLAKSRARGEWAGTTGCQILDGVDPGHCDRALKFPTSMRTRP